MDKEIKLIEGEIFTDYRGSITSMNSFDFSGVERYYIIRNIDTQLIRGWHGHQNEKKWFQCVKGSFTMAFVKIDDWNQPSKDLKPQFFHISDRKSQLLCIPEGYANCLRADEEGSLLMVYSGKKYPECLDDSWRYDANYWFDWKDIKRCL
jgi:dTDP-4-dehydrorhamnose 3,5-epimerase